MQCSVRFLFALLVSGGGAVGCAPTAPAFRLATEEEKAQQREAEARHQLEAPLVALALDRSPALPAAIRRQAEAAVPLDAAGRAARVAAEEERLSLRIGMLAHNQAAAAERAQRDRLALAACRARGRTADVAYPGSGVLRLDAALADAGANRACLDFYRETGIVPGF